MWIDYKLIFNIHINKTVQKVEKTVATLTRIIPNIKRPGDVKMEGLGPGDAIHLTLRSTSMMQGYKNRKRINKLHQNPEESKPWDCEWIQNCAIRGPTGTGWRALYRPPG